MQVSTLSSDELSGALAAGQFQLRFGPFSYGIKTRLPIIRDVIAKLYCDHKCYIEDGFVDFSMHLTKDSVLLGNWRPGASIYYNGFPIQGRFPMNQVVANMEWGMNWCIHKHIFDHLILHCGALERNGRTLMVIGESGAGKSTLSAALANSGWRLLSDEMAIISLDTGKVQALARPIILKDASIDIIKREFPKAVFGPLSPGTIKGDVAHIRPPTESVLRLNETAEPGWVCFPKWSPQPCDLQVEHKDRGKSFIEAAELAFNYNVLGELGFDALVSLIKKSKCLAVTYHDIHEAISFFDDL